MRPMLLTTENNVIRVLAARRYASARALAMALCLCHQWRNYGDRGGTLYPQVQDLYPLHPPSQRCGLCQNFKRTTLTTRLYKVRTNLYPPAPNYENGPTRLRVYSRCSIKTAERIELVLAWELSFNLSYIVLKGNSDISKNEGTSLRNFIPNSGPRKFRHSTSIVETCYRLAGERWTLRA